MADTTYDARVSDHHTHDGLDATFARIPRGWGNGTWIALIRAVLARP